MYVTICGGSCVGVFVLVSMRRIGDRIVHGGFCFDHISILEFTSGFRSCEFYTNAYKAESADAILPQVLE